MSDHGAFSAAAPAQEAFELLPAFAERSRSGELDPFLAQEREVTPLASCGVAAETRFMCGSMSVTARL